MRAWLILVLLTVLYSSCGLFKNTKSNVDLVHQEAEYNTESKMLDSKDWMRTTGRLDLYADSSLHQYAVRLWPKGSFAFSADQGFIGEADSIVIMGSLTAGSASAGVLNIQEQDEGKVELGTTVAGRQSIDQKSKVKVQETSWVWVAGILALVYLLFCIVLYKK